MTIIAAGEDALDVSYAFLLGHDVDRDPGQP